MTNTLSTWLKCDDIYMYRHDKLVYLRNFKCASTFYSSLFERNHWKRQTVLDIDWDHDHVFSFIMDPMERRLKGLAQFIWQEKSLQALLENPEFWYRTSFLDYHSMPYTLTYRNFCDRIDWIPIDHPEFKSEDLVKIMLDDKNISLDWSTVKSNKSPEDKLEIYNKIKKFDSNWEVYHIFEEDQILYDRVCCSIQFHEKTWNDISWLKNFQKSNQDK